MEWCADVVGPQLQNPSTRYHPIIGLVLLALFVVQPVVGFVHHRVYKRVERRQVWSYVHLTIGRWASRWGS